MNVTIAGVTFKALPYAMPAKGNAPEGWFITVDGEPTECRMTGGGKFPRYTYFTHNGKSYYLPKGITLEAGGNIEVVAEAPKAEEVLTGDTTEILSAHAIDVVEEAPVVKPKRSRKGATK